MSVLCRVCLVFPPLVSLFGLFPVLVEWLLVHSCPAVFVSLSMIILCIYSPVCSDRFRLVYSLLPGVPVCVSLALSCPVLPCLALSCLVLPCLALSCPVLPCLALSCPVLPCLALPCPVLPCLALPCPVLPCLVLPCPALPCLALSCPALFGYIKDCYFELHPRLRVPRSSLVCASWQVTRSMKLSSHDFLFHRIINMRNTKPKFPYHHHNEEKPKNIVLMCRKRLLSITKLKVAVRKSWFPPSG